MRHSRLWHNLLLVVAALGPLLAACGGGDEKTPVPGPVPTRPALAGEPGTIRFAVLDWEQAVYKGLIEAFEEANPGLHVQFVSVEETLGLGLGLGPPKPDWAVRLFSAADVAEMGIFSPEITRMGLVRDLTPLIQADPHFRPDDFYPGTLEAYQWDGGTWALPTMVDFELICYNKSSFDETGEPYPEPGWTWDDFLAKARALTMREGDKVIRWGFVVLPDDHGPFVQGRVGSLIDDTTDPPTPRFDRSEVVEAVRWYTDLYLKEQVAAYMQPAEGAEGPSVLDSRTLYDGGLAAMWVDTFEGWQWSAQRNSIGVVPFPVDAPDSRTTPLQTKALVLSAGTSQPDAAWRWMSFLSRQAINGWGSVQYLPPRRSVAEASGFWERLDEELAATLHYAVNHSYTMRLWEPGNAALHRAVGAILKGEKSVEEAMAEAQVQAMAEIREELARQAEATPVSSFVVASPEGQKPAGEGVVAITFVPGLDSVNLQRYRDLARRFHEMHPDVLVEVKMVPFGDARDLQGLANAADCFLWYPSFQYPENRVAVMNLEPLLDADPSFTTDDFYPQVLEQFTWQGQLWGLPAEVEPYVIEYNKDLFDAADLDYPPLDWTTDDFLALAVALTRSEDKQYGFVPEAYEGNVLPLILERLGARLIDESVDPPSLSFDDPSTVEAMRWYAELFTVHGVRPVFVTDLAELEEAPSFYTRDALINEGRAAMWTNTSSESVVALGRGGLDIGVVPLPVKQGGTGGYLSARGYFISGQAENPRACWQWLTFLTKQPEVGQGLPARRSVAESEAYRQQVGDERAAAYLASVAGLERPFQIFSEAPWLRGAMYWLFQAYGQVLRGEASVEEALSIAQKMADDYRACVMARDAFSDQEGWQACLKEIDPTLPDFLFEAGEEE